MLSPPSKPLAGGAGDASSVLLVLSLPGEVRVCLFVCFCAWDPSLSRASSGATDVCVCVCLACAARFEHATPAPARKPELFFPPLPRPTLRGGVSFPKGPVQAFFSLSHPKRAALGGIDTTRNE